MTTPDVTITRARRRFAVGMIVLDPRPGEPGALVWTVARMTTRGVTLVADYGAEQAEATITGPDSSVIPDGWRVLDHDTIAVALGGRALSPAPEEHVAGAPGRTRPLRRP